MSNEDFQRAIRKTFYVQVQDADGFVEVIPYEATSIKAIHTEFREFKLGKILKISENKFSVDEEVEKITSVDVIEEVKSPTPIVKGGWIPPEVVTQVAWNEVTLKSGEVVRVSSTGEVQEQAWKFVSLDKLLSEAGVRIIKNGKVITSLPKGYEIQKLIWLSSDK